ncbi:MAG: DUF692 domain-containing protein [Pseudomonadota bacterium]
MAKADTAAASRSGHLPDRSGLGLKPEHYETVLAEAPNIGWFEVHPENYMGDGGPPHHYLTRIREQYPLSLHGVGLSIGGAMPLSADHLARLKALVDRYEPQSFSEHLAWSTHETGYMNDLLPLPYTHETLAHVCDHISEVQDTVGRRMLLENPSTYVSFSDGDFDELAFLREIVRRTGCGLLLDINNVYVSCTNRHADPYAYVDAFPIDAVGEIHLAGHAEDIDDDGAPLLIDSHDRHIINDVWDLYAHVIARFGKRPTLVEWDENVPDWPVLFAEAQKAERLMFAAAPNRVASPRKPTPAFA